MSQDLVEKAGFEVAYDKNKKEYKVSGEKGSMIFKRSPEGLTYFDMEANKVCMVQTVEGNKIGFTKKEIMRADLAKNLHEMIVFPSVDDYKLIVQSNGIRNCPITLEDIKNAQTIHG